MQRELETRAKAWASLEAAVLHLARGESSTVAFGFKAEGGGDDLRQWVKALVITDKWEGSRGSHDGRCLTGIGAGSRRGCPVALGPVCTVVLQKFWLFTKLPFCSYTISFPKTDF